MNGHCAIEEHPDCPDATNAEGTCTCECHQVLRELALIFEGVDL